jgi:hypothetical protein
MRKRLSIIVLLAATPALALSFFGPRAMALGGAYVAVCEDEASVYYNPGAMAAAEDYFACVPQFGLVSDDRLTEAVDGFLANRQDIYDSIPTEFYDEEDLLPLVEAVGDAHDYLVQYSDGEAGVAGYLSYGAGVMLGPLAVSWLSTGDGQVTFETDPDTGRLIPDYLLDDPYLVALFYQQELLDAEQLTTLWPTYPDPTGFIGDTTGNGVGLDDNRTLTRLANDARQEFVLTYADYVYRNRAGDWAVSAGVNLKYQLHQAYRETFDSHDAGMATTGPLWITERLLSVRPVLGNSFSADLGVHAQLSRYCRFGILGRDVIPSTIEWDEEVVNAPLRLQPTWRLGLAVDIIPDMLTVSTDVDLQEIEGAFSPQQDLAAGVRMRFGEVAWAGAGLLYNLADEQQTPLYTLGGGIKLLGIRFDFTVGLGVVDFSGELDTYFSSAAAVGFTF